MSFKGGIKKTAKGFTTAPSPYAFIQKVKDENSPNYGRLFWAQMNVDKQLFVGWADVKDTSESSSDEQNEKGE